MQSIADSKEYIPLIDFNRAAPKRIISFLSFRDLTLDTEPEPGWQVHIPPQLRCRATLERPAPDSRRRPARQSLLFLVQLVLDPRQVAGRLDVFQPLALLIPERVQINTV